MTSGPSPIPIVPGSWPPKPDGRLRRGDFFWILGIVLVGLAVGAIVMVLWRMLAAIPIRDYPSLCLYLPELNQAESVAGTVAAALAIGWGSWLLARRRGIDAAALGLRNLARPWSLATVALFALCFWVDGLLMTWIDPTGTLQQELVADFFPMQSSLPWAIIVALTSGPVTATAEELLFRGLLYRWFRQRMKTAPAAFLSAVLFAAAHLYLLWPGGFAGLVITLDIVLFGAIAAFLYQFSRSLWPPILYHALYNAAIVAASYTPPPI